MTYGTRARASAGALALLAALSACGATASAESVLQAADGVPPEAPASADPARSVSAPDTGAPARLTGCDVARAGRERKGPAQARAAVKAVLNDPKHSLHHLNLRLVHSRDDGNRVEFFGLEQDPDSTFRVLFIVAEGKRTWRVVRQRVCAARAWPADIPKPGPPGTSFKGTGDVRDAWGVEFGMQKRRDAVPIEESGE